MVTRFSRVGWHDLPEIIRAYRYLALAGWKLFVRRESSDNWLAKWDGKATASAADDPFNRALVAWIAKDRGISENALKALIRAEARGP